ncbi:hypothetical protein CTM50_09705 [Prevotella intermedia]|uniref:Uncharacterized protein n=1 Tax=Prevotella intermedia TaxID=28131 RepID=A0A2D3NCZ3_PREIN|nr:hypothetical protein CTM50_09705 [Prevotella intermedia]
MQNSRFRNAKAQLSLFKRIIFTKPRLFQHLPLAIKRQSTTPLNFYRSISYKKARQRFRLSGFMVSIYNI